MRSSWWREEAWLTIREPLRNVVHGTLDATDGLIVEHDHFAPNCDRGACQGQQSHVDVLLPQVADKIDRANHAEELQTGLDFRIGCLDPCLSTGVTVRSAASLQGEERTFRWLSQCTRCLWQLQALAAKRIRV